MHSHSHTMHHKHTCVEFQAHAHLICMLKIKYVNVNNKELKQNKILRLCKYLFLRSYTSALIFADIQALWLIFINIFLKWRGLSTLVCFYVDRFSYINSSFPPQNSKMTHFKFYYKKKNLKKNKMKKLRTQKKQKQMKLLDKYFKGCKQN